MSDLVQLDPKAFGLEASEAKQVEAAFTPMLQKMAELEESYNFVLKQDISPDTCALAKRVRLDFVKIRTGTAAIHKKTKAYHLAACRFIDGWKNAQLFAAQEKEDKLREIEEHYERIEEERRQKLEEKRLAEISKYGEFPGVNLVEMDEAVYRNFLEGAKVAHERRVEAERKAEAERLAAEQAEKERLRKQAEENARLKAEAEKREKEIAAERARVEAERKRAEAAAQKERERLAEESRKEREALEAKARKERGEAEAKAKAEAKKRARIEAELEARRKAEREAEAARLAAEEAEKAKGEAERFQDFVNEISHLTTRYTFKSKKYAALHSKAVDVLRYLYTELTPTRKAA